jgi:hypothetical protein
MSDNWLIYQDNARMLYDAVEDDLAGALGSNWQPVTYEQSQKFLAEMAQCEGWSRGHWNAPRF